MAVVPSTVTTFGLQARNVGFEWRIQIFNLAAHSSPINIFGENWKLDIYCAVGEEWISMKFWRDKIGRAISVSVVIKRKDGTEENILSGQRLEKDIKVLNVKKFLRWHDLCTRIRDLVPNGILTLGFTFFEDIKPVEDLFPLGFVPHRAEMEVLQDTAANNKEGSSENGFFKGYSKLLKDLKNLQLSKQDKDVMLNVKGKKFSGHKFMLGARSPVFASMFRRDIVSPMEKIQLDDYDPDSFQEFLNYNYTGEVADISLSKAVGLYDIAQKFEVSELEEFCVNYLKNKVTIATLGDVLHFAKRNCEKALLEYAYSFFRSNTKEILDSTEWIEFGKNNFVLANELFIKACERL